MAGIFGVPRVGLPTGTIQWSDGTNFNGVVWISFKGMTSGGSAWGSPTLANGRPIAVTNIIPILNGSFQLGGVFYNEDIVPPGTQYVANYFDSTNTAVGVQTAAFTVTAGTFTPPAVTLTVPSVGPAPTPAT